MRIIDKIKALLDEPYQSRERDEAIKLILGSFLAKNSQQANSLLESEFKIFSQFGDDGIIQYLISKIKPDVESFVEFGVENYEEANTKFLLMNNNWRGLILDGSSKHISHIKERPFFWKYDITASANFITAENINRLLTENKFSGKIGILSIDIDGNDYWVWKAISAVDADIVIIEYNSLFGDERSITIPYKADFVRTKEHYSNLYFGASLAALHDLACEKGYSLVGCNKAGNNAYFVKQEKMNGLAGLTAKDGFVSANFREGRNDQGELNFFNQNDRLSQVKGLTVINTKTGEKEFL